MKLEAIAGEIKARLEGDGNRDISKVANLQTAGEGDISFLTDRRYRESLSSTRASAVIVREADLPHVPAGTPALVMDDPYVGFARVAQLLDTTPPIATGIHPTAVVEEGAVIGEGAALGPHVHVAAGAVIGAQVQLGAGVAVGRNSRIGDYTRLYPNVTVYHDVTIGTHCLIQANAVIGSDGFGYANDRGVWVKIPQTGRVVIGNHVEIGAATCIDRGAIDETVIEDNVIIDNLCQIAHNVRIGSGTAIAGSTTIAGSVTIGRYCIIGGTTVFNGHIKICDHTVINGATAVMRDINEPGEFASQIPAMTKRDWQRNTARYLKLGDMYHTLNQLRREVEQLKSGSPRTAPDGE